MQPKANDKKVLKLESDKSNSSHMHDEVVDKIFNKKESPKKRHKKTLNDQPQIRFEQNSEKKDNNSDEDVRNNSRVHSDDDKRIMF